MKLAFTPEENAFREEVRAFFATALTPELAHAGRHMTSVYSSKEHALAWQKILYDQGWLVPSWPAPRCWMPSRPSTKAGTTRPLP